MNNSISRGGLIGFVSFLIHKKTFRNQRSALTKALNSGQQTGFSQVLFKRDAQLKDYPCVPHPPSAQPTLLSLSHVRYVGGHGSAFKVAQMGMAWPFMTKLTLVFVSTKPDKGHST